MIFKDYLEVNPDFLDEFGSHIQKFWTVIDKDGKTFRLKFNGDLSLPLLEDGFTDLRNHYHLQNMQQIYFDYIGQNQFMLHFGNVIEDTNNLPSFHSRSTKQGRTNYFDITLNQLQMSRPEELVYSFILITY
jgi:hypothetical protein